MIYVKETFTAVLESRKKVLSQPNSPRTILRKLPRPFHKPHNKYFPPHLLAQQNVNRILIVKSLWNEKQDWSLQRRTPQLQAITQSKIKRIRVKTIRSRRISFRNGIPRKGNRSPHRGKETNVRKWGLIAGRGFRFKSKQLKTYEKYK